MFYIKGMRVLLVRIRFISAGIPRGPFCLFKAGFFTGLLTALISPGKNL